MTNPARFRCLTALSLTALSFLVAACTSGTHRSVSPPTTMPEGVGSAIGPTGTVTTAPPTTTPPEMLSPGQVGERSDVPWSLVGSGWFLVVHQARPPTIVLVDPLGGRYEIAPAPAGPLVDWSGDGHRALFQVHCGRCDPMDTETLVDLQTGAQQTLHFPGAVMFTRPNGLALLQYGFNEGTVRRLGLGGDLQVSYPTSFPGAGTTTGQLVAAPDGSELALTTTNGYEIVTNAGDPVRLVTPPLPINTCYLEQWLPDYLDQWLPKPNLLVTCQGGFWAIPVDGELPSRLTPATGDHLLSLTPFAHEFAAQADNATYGQCHNFLDRLHADLTITRMNVPLPTQNENIRIVGTYQNRIAITYSAMSADCLPQDPITLAWYDAANNNVKPLLTESTGGSAFEVFSFGHS